jgi:hypothetical protein
MLLLTNGKADGTPGNTPGTHEINPRALISLLVTTLDGYLKLGSTDGKQERQDLRRKLRVIVETYKRHFK